MKCRGCGCTAERACPPGCWWVAQGLDVCSFCILALPPIHLLEVIFGPEAARQAEAIALADVAGIEVDTAALRREVLG